MHTSARSLGGVGLPRFARNDGGNGARSDGGKHLRPVIASVARQSIFACQKPTLNLG